MSSPAYNQAAHDSRSLMNITFNLQTEELNKQFLQVAEEQGFIGLQGHRSSYTYFYRPYSDLLLITFLAQFQALHH